MAGTNIEAIFGQIEKDFVELSKNAARSAANKAQKDIQNKADKFVEEYKNIIEGNLLKLRPSDGNSHISLDIDLHTRICIEEVICKSYHCC